MTGCEIPSLELSAMEGEAWTVRFVATRSEVIRMGVRCALRRVVAGKQA